MLTAVTIGNALDSNLTRNELYSTSKLSFSRTAHLNCRKKEKNINIHRFQRKVRIFIRMGCSIHTKLVPLH